MPSTKGLMAKAMFVIRGGEYFPPAGLMQISSIAKEAGHEIGLGVLSKENVLNKVAKEKPDVVAYTSVTGEHSFYFQFNHALKKEHPEVATIMGGPHSTFFPEGTIKRGGFDAVCIGEGDYTFTDFLDRVDNGRDFTGLENIMTKDLKSPPLKPLVTDLDSLPELDRALFYDAGESGKHPIKHFFVTRGCPYKCTYCFNEALRGMYPGQKYIRRRSVGSVIEEVKRVKREWPLEFVKFYDDIFSLRADDWMREFAEKFPREIGLPFFALMRADLMTKELADLFKEAGCNAISMSIETANPELREKVLDRKMSSEQIKRAYKLCGERGIAIQSNNILGLPTSTIEDDIRTVDFNIECGWEQDVVVLGEFGTAHPYPGTSLGRFCEEHRLYETKSGFFDMHMSYHDESPLNCFTPMEKRMQRNLTMLGTVATSFPRTRNLIVNHLIKLPTNPLYFAAFYLTKTVSYMRHIYPRKYTLRDYATLIPKSFKLDWAKRMSGGKWKKKAKEQM